MVSAKEIHRHGVMCRLISTFLIVVFTFGVVYPPYIAEAQVMPVLPIPGAMVMPTNVYMPTMIKGIEVHPENPLKFNFIIDTGDTHLTGQALHDEFLRLIKYFLASLTVPENELWVNLSPYEGDRVIPQNFGATEMGRDLLAQDYILKQLTASLMYPEQELGKKFWDRVYERTQKEFGTIDIEMDTFHKVWIVPDQADVYQTGNHAFVMRSHLKVMLEEDYFAERNNLGDGRARPQGAPEIAADQMDGGPGASRPTALQTQVMKEIIIPEIEKEVNEGQTFVQLRQIYQSMILAVWFKKNLKESLLGQIYVDRNKTRGVDTDPAHKEKIYEQYVQAFEQGVYNYIKEEVDPRTNQVVPRNYFSGGFEGGRIRDIQKTIEGDFSMLSRKDRMDAVSAVRPAGRTVDTEVNLLEDRDPTHLAAAKPRQEMPGEIEVTVAGVTEDNGKKTYQLELRSTNSAVGHLVPVAKAGISFHGSAHDALRSIEIALDLAVQNGLLDVWRDFAKLDHPTTDVATEAWRSTVALIQTRFLDEISKVQYPDTAMLVREERFKYNAGMGRQGGGDITMIRVWDAYTLSLNEDKGTYSVNGIPLSATDQVAAEKIFASLAREMRAWGQDTEEDPVSEKEITAAIRGKLKRIDSAMLTAEASFVQEMTDALTRSSAATSKSAADNEVDAFLAALTWELMTTGVVSEKTLAQGQKILTTHGDIVSDIRPIVDHARSLQETQLSLESRIALAQLNNQLNPGRAADEELARLTAQSDAAMLSAAEKQIEVERGLKYWQMRQSGQTMASKLERPFRASRREDVTDVTDMDEAEALRLERLAMDSLLRGEGLILSVQAGASSRMDPKDAPQDVKEMAGREIVSKAGVPIGVVDGQVITYQDAFFMNLARLFRAIELEAHKAGVEGDIWENGYGMLTNDTFRAEHEMLFDAHGNYGLPEAQKVVFEQPLGAIYEATPEDVKDLYLRKKITEEKYWAAMARAREVEARIQNGEKDAVILEGDRQPLGHAEFLHQLVASGTLLWMIENGKKWFFTKNIDNYASKFDRIWLRTIGLMIDQGLDFQVEVHPRTPGVEGGSVVVFTDEQEGQAIVEDPTLRATTDAEGKMIVNPGESYWFNDAVGAGSLDFAIDIYKAEGQTREQFVQELREARQNKDLAEAIAERGRSKFPKLIDPKPAKVGDGISVKIETNMWNSTFVASPERKIKMVGVRGARNFPIDAYAEMTPEQSEIELAKLRFLSTKRWRLSPTQIADIKAQMEAQYGRPVSDAEVQLGLETYDANRALAQDMLEYVMKAPLVAEGIFDTTDAAMLVYKIQEVPGTKIVRDSTILEWTSPHGVPLTKVLGSIIKEYDMRGYDGGDDAKYPQQMDSTLLRWFGRGLGSLTFSSARHEQQVALQPGDSFVFAGDNGPLTSKVKEDQVEGLRDTEVTVIDLGVVGSGLLYSAMKRLGAKGAAYVTRSHVEVGTNGVKPNINGITLYGEMLKDIQGMIEAGQYRQADQRGQYLGPEHPLVTKAIDEYFAELETEFADVPGTLDRIAAKATKPMKITVNMAGGSLTAEDTTGRQRYVEFFRKMFGPHLGQILRMKGDPWGKEGGLADPTRLDDTALGHPKANILEYSKTHPDELIFNFDLDADRVTILWNGRLYLGDSMFFPVIEYMLTIDEAHGALEQGVHQGLNRTYFYDSRMSSEIQDLILHFGGLKKIHPKGHSKVKATMDLMLRILAQREGKTVEEFLDAHPRFKLMQAEFTTHMFTTNKNGEPFDDAVLFAMSWIKMFSAIKEKYNQPDWTLRDYINYLRESGAMKEAFQLQEQRMPMDEEAKFTVMWRMTELANQFLGSRSDFNYVAEWKWDEAEPSNTFVLQNVEGVFDLQTPLGEMFWGWSNTSAKIALGAQSTSKESLGTLAGIVGALYIHSRQQVAQESGKELPPIHPKETTAFFKLLGLSNAVYEWAGMTKEEYAALDDARRAALEKQYYPQMSAKLEGIILEKYPTLDSVRDALTGMTDAAMLTAESRELVVDEMAAAGFSENVAQMMIAHLENPNKVHFGSILKLAAEEAHVTPHKKADYEAYTYLSQTLMKLSTQFPSVVEYESAFEARVEAQPFGADAAMLATDSLTRAELAELGNELKQWQTVLDNLSQRRHAAHTRVQREQIDRSIIRAQEMIAQIKEEREEIITARQMALDERTHAAAADQSKLGTEVGGIDLNPAFLDLKIKRDGNGIPLPMVDQPMQELMQIEGFVPIIINVTPVSNLPMLLGMDIEPINDQNEEYAKLSFYRKVDVFEYKFVVREEFAGVSLM